MYSELRYQDLLRLREPFPPPEGRATSARPTWVVARGTLAPDGHVAVVVRGPAYSRRGAMVPLRDIAEVLRPEQLVYRVGQLSSQVPAALALHMLRARLQTLPLRWGPTGGAGYELATGSATLCPSSDLDIVVRFSSRPTRHILTRLHEATKDLPARLDAELDFNFGVVKLNELMSNAREVSVKTLGGPVLMPATMCWRLQ